MICKSFNSSRRSFSIKIYRIAKSNYYPSIVLVGGYIAFDLKD
jgi:hypothetical protein